MNKISILLLTLAIIGLSESRGGSRGRTTVAPTQSYNQQCDNVSLRCLKNVELKCISGTCQCESSKYQWNGSACVKKPLSYNQVCRDNSNSNSNSASSENEVDRCDASLGLSCNIDTDLCSCSIAGTSWDSVQNKCV